MANGKNHPTATDILKLRIETLKSELAGVAEKISALEERRQLDVSSIEEELFLARDESNAAKQVKDSVEAAADDTERKGKALISSGEKLIHSANAQRQAAEEMDLGLKKIAEVGVRLEERREYWRAELATIQDGATRRKRSILERSLAKLEERLTRKATEELVSVAPVLPKHRGTPEPETKSE